MLIFSNQEKSFSPCLSNQSDGWWSPRSKPYQHDTKCLFTSALIFLLVLQWFKWIFDIFQNALMWLSVYRSIVFLFSIILPEKDAFLCVPRFTNSEMASDNPASVGLAYLEIKHHRQLIAWAPKLPYWLACAKGMFINSCQSTLSHTTSHDSLWVFFI